MYRSLRNVDAGMSNVLYCFRGPLELSDCQSLSSPAGLGEPGCEEDFRG
jgi:hypothetical protein